jgi:hypothetical protein
MRMMAAMLLAMASAVHAQDAASSAPGQGFEAYSAAEDCMRDYGRRFAPTTANPQDVADAALAACSHKRYAAAIEAALRRHYQASTANTAGDEAPLRRLTIQACLEARYPQRK